MPGRFDGRVIGFIKMEFLNPVLPIQDPRRQIPPTRTEIGNFTGQEIWQAIRQQPGAGIDFAMREHAR